MKGLLILTLLTSSLMTQAHAALGNSSGGGGTIISANFVAHGEFALKILKITVDEINQEVIDQVINDTSVYDLEQERTQNPNTGEIYVYDARYIPEYKEIRFSRKNWKQLNCNEKLALTAHEYLRAAGLEGANYKYSYAFISGNYSEDSDKNLAVKKEISGWCSRNINKSK